ncbi:hypothetical protein DPX16_0670 [Anabarilius grahami]|uniref:Uncharacterized protein n=1 Tax=Anabarilius grahami TaxID=495550 RepID=A0A3N0XR44_ANAGA|nr:hypothetical protein DPX16_0670 [Anabarilius grahami]
MVRSSVTVQKGRRQGITVKDVLLKPVWINSSADAMGSGMTGVGDRWRQGTLTHRRGVTQGEQQTLESGKQITGSP